MMMERHSSWARPRRDKQLAAAMLLLAAMACQSPEVPPESRQAASLSPDLAGIEGVQRRQIELLLAALERDRDAGGGDLADSYGELGNAYHIAELLDAAAEAYANARRLAPDDVHWAYYAGMVHDARGDLAAASAGFERALELAPDDLAARLRLGDVQLRLNQREAARASFAAALELDPASAAAHHGQARLAAVDSDPQAAIRHLEQALELQPEADGIRYPLAQAYRRLGDEDRAQIHLGQRGERETRFPDPLADRLSRAKTLTAFELVDAQAAEPVATVAEDGGLSDEDFLGFVFEQVGEVDAAAAQLTRMLERGPVAEPAAGRNRQRESDWRARMHYAIGGLLAREGSDIEAASNFERALELRPDLRDARLRLANGLGRLRRFEQAVDQYSILLESDPEDVALLLKRATARLHLERVDAADADLRRVVDLDPGNGRAHLRLASFARRAGRTDDAIDHLEEALATDLPAGPRLLAHRTVAALFQASGRDREALTHFEAATALAPDEVELKGQLARLLASSPDATVRDGARAVALAEALFGTDRSLSNAETMAMALAAAGRFAEAADLQRRLLAEAVNFGYRDQLRRLRRTQERYKRRQVALPPDPE